MDSRTPPSRSGLRTRAYRELKVFGLTALYLWIFLGSFSLYRRLILAEAGVSYLNYGFALVEALIIAKVILIGRLFGFSRRYEGEPLIVPVAYKTLFFGVLVMAFSLLEHMLEGLFRGQGGLGGLHEMFTLGIYEISARVLMLIIALVPFFALMEMGRVLGMDRLSAMFFRKPVLPQGRGRDA
ncbi:MAG: hypothetical protein ER33_14860 [Cyanobium sp. CACIAM 14]|nr:MAG: hypothetical protein ER33_14860 [Cyanobium sp. CACIAM 14]